MRFRTSARDRQTVDWMGLLDDARRRGASGCCCSGELAHSLQLCEVPPELLDAVPRDSHVASLSRRVTRGIFDLNRAVEFEEWPIGSAL